MGIQRINSWEKITISELEKQVADNELMSKEVLQMSNKNQQYSRKFNIKILSYHEKKGEN